MWVSINGYKSEYRINEDGIVQKHDRGNWVTLCSSGKSRAFVSFRSADGKRKKVPVVRLMTDAFLGGCPKGMAVVHKNRCKSDNALHNLCIVSVSEAAKMADNYKRRPTEKIDSNGKVIEIYRSQTAAAKANYSSINSVHERCSNKLKDPFLLSGF